MTIEERLPGLSDKELLTLQGNAERLARAGAPKQQSDAERLLPLIEAEQAERRRNRPAPVKAVAKRPPAKRKKA